MKRFFLIFLIIGGYLPLNAVQVGDVDDGSPFGTVNDADIEHLMAFAKAEGVNLSRDLELAYKNDDAALSRVFQFSLKFTKLDENARTYGQIIWSSLLNMAEVRGIVWYSGLVAQQPKEVQQRIRDFLHYAVSIDEPSHEKDMSEKERAEWLKLFPKDYAFGASDPIFEKGANQPPVAFGVI